MAIKNLHKKLGGSIIMKKIISLVLVIAFAFSLMLATGCGENPSTTESTTTAPESTVPAATEAPVAEVKAGFVFIGPAQDGGWSQAHDNGRLQLEKDLGIKTMIKESVPENQDVEKAMKDLIDQGCNVIFATSFGYMDSVEKVSKEYPDVKFFHCSGYKQGENFANYFGRIYEPEYLTGIIAGLKTKTNKIGFVASMTIPEVYRNINGFALGVQSVNPDARVHIKWTNTWYDPAKEKEAAKALLDEGCDIMAQDQDSPAAQLAAEERGALAFGYDLDSPSAAPKAYMTAPIWNWGAYYVDQIKQIQAGTWKATSYFGGLKDGICELAPITALVEDDIKAKVNAAAEKIKDGSLTVFQGPISDNAGKVRIEKDVKPDDATLLSMDYLVSNVVGPTK
jgi:basic membrane protein A and related proteins